MQVAGHRGRLSAAAAEHRALHRAALDSASRRWPRDLKERGVSTVLSVHFLRIFYDISSCFDGFS